MGKAFNKYCTSVFSICTRNVNFVVVVNTYMYKYTYVEINIHSFMSLSLSPPGDPSVTNRTLSFTCTYHACDYVFLHFPVGSDR